MRLTVKLLVFVLAAGMFQSCVSSKKYKELEAAKQATDQALAETQDQVKTLTSENETLASDLETTKTELGSKIANIESELSATKGEMSQVKEKLTMTEGELNKLKEQINGIFSAYTNSGLSLEDKDGRLLVVTSNPVNYGSSSSYLKKDQRDAIDALAEKLKANPAVKIMVAGHTDSQRFNAESGMDNWSLSIRRAENVVRRLIRKGVNPNQLTIAGKADTVPAGDNGSAEGRKANRRTEIMANPDLGGLKAN